MPGFVQDDNAAFRSDDGKCRQGLANMNVKKAFQWSRLTSEHALQRRKSAVSSVRYIRMPGSSIVKISSQPAVALAKLPP
ncbi:MAG: hypothetical protein V4582_25165 [Pseudomonadota bacterium]